LRKSLLHRAFISNPALYRVVCERIKLGLCRL
jgi:hypothetical protein